MSWYLYPSEPRQRRSTSPRRRHQQHRIVGAGRLPDGDVVSGTPLIGDDIAGALAATGGASGGNVVELALTGDTAGLAPARLPAG